MATKKMALIATKGTLDMAYPPFILASTAAARGWDVQIFFTFYGLQLLRTSLDDIKITRELVEAGRVMKIEVLDHIIVGKRTVSRATDYISLKEMGVL